MLCALLEARIRLDGAMMSRTVHAFEFLDAEHVPEVTPVCVLFGDEAFLRGLVSQRLIAQVAGDDETPFAVFDGKTAEWRDVLDELSTVSLFGGGRRLAMVEDADDFVSKYRSELEDYVANPARGGILVLKVASWAANTRLYKSLDKTGLQIECRPPEKSGGKKKMLDETRLRDWLISWARVRHRAQMSRSAASRLLELAGPHLGLLDQEIAKLALFIAPGGKIGDELVEQVVGGWRTKTIWDLLDAAADGDAAEALGQLDRLLQAGENPLALFGQISWSLRRFAAATKTIELAEANRTSIALDAALEQAGFRRFPKILMDKAQRQLKQLGRDRAGQLYRWLLEADLALKGSHSADRRARLVLEKLIVRMSKQFAPGGRRRRAAGATS